MPIIYLEHPQHGRKIAYMEVEATYDELHGWKRYNPLTPPAAPVNELETRRKYSRKEVPA